MRRIASPFSLWVLPLRVFGVAVFLYAFVRMLVAPDLTLLVVAVIGSLLWQVGTAAEEHSPLYRRLESTPVKHIMRNLAVRVRSWMSVSRFRSEHPALGRGAFIITTQDGYDAGLLTLEELDRVSDEVAPHTPIGQIARPLIYVHGLRMDDSVLEAFVRFRPGHHTLLPILDRRDTLAGVVTAQDVDRWLHNHEQTARRPLETAGEERHRKIEEKLAA